MNGISIALASAAAMIVAAKNKPVSISNKYFLMGLLLIFNQFGDFII